MMTFMTLTAVYPGRTAELVVNVSMIVTIEPAGEGKATVLHLHGMHEPVLVTLPYAEFYHRLDRVTDLKLVR